MRAVLDIHSKICLAGDSAVGKTSLIRRYVLNQFDDKHLVTLGTKVSKKKILLKHPKQGIEVNLTLMLWDVMGQLGFRALLHEEYFRGAKGAIVVFDLTRKETLVTIDDWIHSINNITGQIPLVFLGNKNDLRENITLKEDDINNALSKYNAPYFATSALTGENVEPAFMKIGELLLLSGT